MCRARRDQRFVWEWDWRVWCWLGLRDDDWSRFEIRKHAYMDMKNTSQDHSNPQCDIEGISNV